MCFQDCFDGNLPGEADLECLHACRDLMYSITRLCGEGGGTLIQIDREEGFSISITIIWQKNALFQ